MKRTFQYFALFILILKFSLSNAQGGFRSRIYLPESATHVSKAIFEKSDGTYIAAGISVEKINGLNVNRLVLMGVDANGTLTWTKKYGVKTSEILENNLTMRSFFRSGNHIFFVGCIAESGVYASTLFKFNLQGDSIWQKKYFMPGFDLVAQMGATSTDNGFLITGFAQDAVNSGRPCFILKTDINGVELWKKLYPKTNPNVSDGKAIIQDSLTKKIIITGYQYINTVQGFDNVLVADSLGNEISRHAHEPSPGGYRYDMCQLASRQIVVIGSSKTFTAPGIPQKSNATVTMFDLDSVDKPLWEINLDPPTKSNHNQCISKFSNGDILVGGLIDSTSSPLTGHCRFTRIDKTGKVIWKKYYYYGASDRSSGAFTMSALETTSSGGWIAAFKLKILVPNLPFFFVKYDSTGCDTTEYYCKTVGLNEHVLAGTLIYPSPVNDVLNIELHIVTNVDVVITNLIGQEVKTERISGEIDYQIDMGDLPGGIYVVSLRQGKNNVFQKKVVKIN